MSRTMKLDWLIVILFFAFSVSCSRMSAVNAISTVQTPDARNATEKIDGGEKKFSFRNVSFLYDERLAGKIEASEVSAVLPDDSTFRPDGIGPSHLSIRFVQPSAKQNVESSFPAELKVYSIEEYQRAFQDMADYKAVVEKKIQRLRTILSEKPSELNGELPFIQFVDATQLLKARKSYVSFKDGSGISYLTQFNHSDPMLVNNSGLVYVFQGITSDGKHLISATFPISTPLLPNQSNSVAHRGYSIPDNFYDAKHRDENEKNYKKYLLDVENELNLASSERFVPNWTSIEKLISSLEIRSFSQAKH